MNWCYYFIDLQQKAIFSKNWGVPEKDRFFGIFLVFYFFGFFSKSFFFGFKASGLLFFLLLSLSFSLLLFFFFYCGTPPSPWSSDCKSSGGPPSYILLRSTLLLFRSTLLHFRSTLLGITTTPGSSNATKQSLAHSPSASSSSSSSSTIIDYKTPNRCYSPLIWS